MCQISLTSNVEEIEGEHGNGLEGEKRKKKEGGGKRRGEEEEKWKRKRRKEKQNLCHLNVTLAIKTILSKFCMRINLCYPVSMSVSMTYLMSVSMPSLAMSWTSKRNDWERGKSAKRKMKGKPHMETSQLLDPSGPEGGRSGSTCFKQINM